MILKYFKNVLSNFYNLSEKNKVKLTTQILSRIGKNQEEIDKIINQIKTETNIDELNKSLSKDFNLEFFGDIIIQIAQFQNMSDVAKNLQNLQIDESKITNYTTLEKILYNQDDPTLRLSLLLKVDISKKSKKEIYYLIQKLFSINKEQLSQEFQINKRTLNKWLKYFFREKYSGNRKIYLNDYILIYKAFYINENEKIDDSELIETIRKRVIKGPSYFKKDIAQYLSSNLETQKNNVEHLEFYTQFDKVPYSLAHIIVKKMGDSFNF